MAINKNIKLVPGMIILNRNQETRIIKEVHEIEEGNCTASSTRAYPINGPHLWFTTGTYMTVDNCYIMCTLISTPQPESIIKIIDNIRSRLDLITD